MHLHHAPGEGRAEADAVPVPGMAFPADDERVPDPALAAGREAGPVVAHGDRPAAVRVDLGRHARNGAAMGDDVRQKAGQRAADPRPVREDAAGRRRRDLDRLALHRGEVGVGLVRHLVEPRDHRGDRHELRHLRRARGRVRDGVDRADRADADPGRQRDRRAGREADGRLARDDGMVARARTGMRVMEDRRPAGGERAAAEGLVPGAGYRVDLEDRLTAPRSPRPRSAPL